MLRALEGHGLPVPAVLALGVDERPFLVMERLPGAPPGRLTADERTDCSGGSSAPCSPASMHSTPRELGLAAAGSPSERHARAGAPVPARSTRPRGRRPCRCSARSSPGPSGTARRTRCRPAVLWGDPGAHNMLVADGHVSALLDWELTHIGDPLDDLGAAVWSCLGSFDPDDIVAGYEEVAGAVDRQRLSYFVALASATRSVMVVNGTAAWIDGDVSSPANAALGLELLALDLARGARAAGWGDLPASDGLPPSYPLRPDPAETAAGVGRWLLDDLAPALEDRRLRQMAKRAAALLATTARRIPPSPGSDPAAAELEAVAAERAGGDPALQKRAARRPGAGDRAPRAAGAAARAPAAGSRRAGRRADARSGALVDERLAAQRATRPALLLEQVERAEHLAEREEGLVDGNVGPEHDAELARAAGPVGRAACTWSARLWWSRMRSAISGR